MNKHPLKVYGVTRFPKESEIIPCDDISIVTSPETLREIAKFLISCAENMAVMDDNITDEWHMHLRDSMENWHEEMTDIIVCAAQKSQE